MSNDYRVHRDAHKANADAQALYPLWEGEVTAPPGNAGFVRVRSVHSAGADEFDLGEAPWTTRNGVPRVGDICLVGLDVTHQPWIIQWLVEDNKFVSVLPTEPRDGQVIYFQDALLATKGVVWHLRYHESGMLGGSAYKWEYVGGSDWWTVEGVISGVVPKADTPFVVGASSFTLPLSGDYDVSFTYTAVNRNATATQLTTVFPIRVSDKANIGSVPFAGLESLAGSSGAYSAASVQDRIQGRAAGTAVAMGAQVTSTPEISWYNLSFRIRPIRVI